MYGYRTHNQRRGVALILVLVLIVMISLGAYTFTDNMISQERKTVMAGRRVQAKAAVASGVEYLKDYLVMAPEDQAAVGGHWDNAPYFKDVAVSSSPAGDGSDLRFSIVAVAQDSYGEPTGWRFGLEDEGAKLNINTLATSDLFAVEEEGGQEEDSLDPATGEPGEAGEPTDATGEEGELGEEVVDPRQFALMQLPNMTEQIADSILDWIDEDEDMRAAGAEADMYSMMLNYSPSNGPIVSLDELLLVQGVTPELLYGADRNHNGIIDESEQNDAASGGGAEGSMARGWSAYLTVSSKDVLPQSEDPEPVDVNGDDLEEVYNGLLEVGIDADLATYIIAYRQGGAYTPPEIPEDAPDNFELPEAQAVSGREPTFEGGDNKVESVLDIIASSTEGTYATDDDKTEKVLVASPFDDSSNLAGILPDLNRLLAIGDGGGEGRVNLNHCPSSVINGLPGIEFGTAQNILLSQNPTSGDANFLYPTWPLAQGSVTVEEMKALLPYVSGVGTVFRAQIIGYSDVPGVYARAEVVIDASGELPKVVSWRDLTHLEGAKATLQALNPSL